MEPGFRQRMISQMLMQLCNMVQLCNVCRNVDFLMTTNPGMERDSRYNFPLGSLSGIVSKANVCGFCGLVFQAARHIPGIWSPDGHEAYVGQCTLLLDEGIRYQVASGEYVRSERSFKLRMALSRENNPLLDIEISLPRIANDDTVEAALNCARIRPNVVNFDLIKSWIKKCELWHDECKPYNWIQAPERPTELRVIDVIDKRLVRAPDSCRYVALSYVWGKDHGTKLTRANLASFQEMFAFQNPNLDLRQTLSDAMVLVGLVGERYLWIDSLCVLQDGPGEIEIFEAMDGIYRNAVFTIIAASGKDSNAGLPGVRPHSRNLSQPIAMVLPGVYLSAEVPYFDVRLDASTWNSRAWTFQERLMSRRELVFLNDQIYWVCAAETWSETRILEHQLRSRLRMRQRRFKWCDISGHLRVALDDERKPLFDKRLIRTGALDMYFSTVETYTLRDLSRRHDILNAFAGLSRGHSIAMDCQMFFGLPTKHLDQALLWFRKSTNLTRRICEIEARSSGRRIPFPTWSWSSWVGPIQHDSFHPPAQNRDPREERIRGIIHWYRLVRGSEESEDNKEVFRQLNAGIAVEARQSDKLVRIQQAYEDPTNPQEGPLMTMSTHEWLRQSFIARRIERGEDTESKVISTVDQMGLTNDAAYAHFQRTGIPGTITISQSFNPSERMGPNDIGVTHSGTPLEAGDLDVLIREVSEVHLSDGSTAPQTETWIDSHVHHEQLPGDNNGDATMTVDEEIAFLNTKILKRDFRYLYFRSSCASFKVAACLESTEDMRYRGHFGPRHAVLNKNGDDVGWVQLHTPNDVFKTGPNHEFVIISENQKYDDFSSPSLHVLKALIKPETEREGNSQFGEVLHSKWHHFQIWNVLLVEWKSSGVAYRIGIGRIWKQAWGDGYPCIKVIPLG